MTELQHALARVNDYLIAQMPERSVLLAWELLLARLESAPAAPLADTAAILLNRPAHNLAVLPSDT